MFSKLDLGFDLVAQIEVTDGVSRRLWSSKSHLTVLGHDPASCNGEETTLTHLYTAAALDELPGLVTAFERGVIEDGMMGEYTLLHADGRELWFEWRVSLDRERSDRLLVVWRDITDRRERHRLELENACLAVARQKDEEVPVTLPRVP